MQNVFDAWGSGHGSLFAIVCKNLFTLVPMCKILNVHTHVFNVGAGVAAGLFVT